MESLQKLKQQFAEATTVALFVHRSPDGDCLGSGLAMGALLEAQGKQVSYFCPTPYGEVFTMFPKVKEFSTDFSYKAYDLLLFLDTAAPQQISYFRDGHEEYFASQHKIVIDHHVSNTAYGDLNIIDPTASSVCELLTEIVQEVYADEITPTIASYLFMGLSTDTGNFMYDKDSIRTFKAALYLLEQGADKPMLIKKLYRSNKYDQIKTMGVLLDRMTQQGKIIYTRYTQEDLDTYHLDKDQVEAFIPLMTSIQHEGIFALFKTSSYDLNPLLRCSLRSNSSNYNVSHIAEYFGGGGHHAAAGCSMLIEKDIPTTMQDMLAQMQDLLN